MTDRIQIALYKGPPKLADPVHVLSHVAICARTLSKYSHGELVVNDIAYSSSARDKGVRSKVIDFTNGKWDLFDIDPKVVNIDHAMYIFGLYEGSRYDWQNIARYILPFVQQSPGKFVCFEFMGFMLNHAGSYKLTGNDWRDWAIRNQVQTQVGDFDEAQY